MLTIRRTSKTEYANMITISRRAVSTLIISSVVILGVSGCGQKGSCIWQMLMANQRRVALLCWTVPVIHKMPPLLVSTMTALVMLITYPIRKTRRILSYQNRVLIPTTINAN